MVTHTNVPVADGDVPPPIDPNVPRAVTGGSRVPRDWRWLVPVIVAASTAAWLAGVLSGHVGGGWQVVLVVAGAVLTSVAVGLPLWKERSARVATVDALLAARQARAATRVALEDSLDPFVALITALIESRGVDKARFRGEAIQLAVATAAQLCDADRVRVCFFVLDPGPPRQLIPERFAGRSGAPTTTFVEGTRAGTAALRLLDSHACTFVADTSAHRPALWWDDAPEYRTFLTVPVSTPQAGEGLLTLDALAPGELAQVDVRLIRLIADLLAAALRA